MQELTNGNDELYDGLLFKRKEDKTLDEVGLPFQFALPTSKKKQRDNFLMQGRRTTSTRFIIETSIDIDIKPDDVIKIPKFNIDGNVTSAEPNVIDTLLLANVYYGADKFTKLVEIDV